MGIFDQPGKMTFLTDSLDSIRTAASGSPDTREKEMPLRGNPDQVSLSSPVVEGLTLQKASLIKFKFG